MSAPSPCALAALRGFYGIVGDGGGDDGGDRGGDGGGDHGGDRPGDDDAAAVRRADRLAQTLLEGGACVLQVRMKHAPVRTLVAVSRAVLARCRAAGVPFVVNDRLDVALAVGADGVHLGQDDLDLIDARAAAAGRLFIGVSTHSAAQAAAAARAGADYLGFGPVYATASKANPDPVQGVAALAEAVRRAAPVPVVAIGGITPARVVEVAAAGAAAACVIAAVNLAPDVVAAARAVGAAFQRPA